MDRKNKKIKKGNILVLTHWSYNDALIQVYTLPYLKIIREKLPREYKMILVTMEQEKLALTAGSLAQLNQEWKKYNMEIVAFPYTRFGLGKLLSSVKQLLNLCWLIRKEKIKTLHAFCTPAGAAGYILGKLTGRPLVIDSYEPHADRLRESKTWKENGVAFRIMKLLEKRQTQYASFFIGATKSMKHYAQTRFQVDPEPFFVKPACVDLDKFKIDIKDEQLLQELKLNGKIVCVYAGKLGGIYLREELFDFLKQCFLHWGDRFRFLMLTNATEEEVKLELNRAGIPGEIIVQRFVTHREVPVYMALGHFAINPVKPTLSARYGTPIKDGEYWAAGLPVVITKKISDDSEIIEENRIGYELQALNDEEYRKAIARVEELLREDPQRLREKIRSIAKKYRSYRIAEDIYTNIYS